MSIHHWLKSWTTKEKSLFPSYLWIFLFSDHRYKSLSHGKREFALQMGDFPCMLWSSVGRPPSHLSFISSQLNCKQQQQKTPILTWTGIFFLSWSKKKMFNIHLMLMLEQRAIKKYHRIAFPNCAMCVHSTRNPYICSLRLAWFPGGDCDSAKHTAMWAYTWLWVHTKRRKTLISCVFSIKSHCCV